MNDAQLITAAKSRFKLSQQDATKCVSLVTTMFRNRKTTAETQARYGSTFGADRDDTHEFVMFVLLRFEGNGK